MLWNDHFHSNTFFVVLSCRQSRTTFDTAENRKEFGPIVVDYAKVQSKVNMKYDSWHKEILSKFGTSLGTEMTDFHVALSKVSGWKNMCDES